VVVYMVPGPQEPGNLESLCVEAAQYAHAEQMECVDALIKCVDITNWSVAKQAKARVRAFISIAHQRRPDISLTKVWTERPDLFPVNASALTNSVRFSKASPA